MIAIVLAMIVAIIYGESGMAELLILSQVILCDLIAMSTHRHKLVKDVLCGSVANEVRRITRVPVAPIRGEPA